MKRICLLFCAFALSLSAAQPVKMGVVLDLTGGAAFIGEQLKAGMQMRLAEEPTDGPLAYELLFEDDQLKPAQSVMAYKKLTNVDGCQIVIAPLMSDTLCGFAAKDEVLFWGMSWDTRAAADELAFIHCTPVEPQSRLMLEALSAQGVRRVAIVGELQQGSMAMQKELQRLAPDFGIETKLIRTNPGEKDFRSVVLKFHDFDPDAYVSLIFMPAFQLLADEVKRADPTTIFTAIEGFSYLDDLTPWEGYWYVAGNEPTPAFAQKAADAGYSAQGFFANGYDMVDLIINAVEDSQSADNQRLAAQLMELKDYPGAVGLLSMRKDRVVNSIPVLKRIVGGEAQVVGLEGIMQPSDL